MASVTLQTNNLAVSNYRPLLKDLIVRIKNLDRFSLFTDGTLVRELKEIDATELNTALESVFSQLMQEGRDPLKVIEKLAALVPPNKLEQAIAQNRSDFKGGVAEARDLFKVAKVYLAAQNSLSLPVKEHLRSLLDAIVNFLDSFLSVFGIAHILKPAEGEIHASFKSQTMMMLLQLVFMLCSVLLPMLGYETGGMVILGTFGGTAVLSLIFPYIRPMPTRLPAKAECWTKEIREGKGGSRGRKESLDAMADIIKRNRHVALVGPSRVGKGLTVFSLAEAVERGDYPELAGKMFFRINAANMVRQTASFMGGGNDIHYKIKEAMGRHAKDIVLVIDEFHMLCKDATMADQLKPFLDEGGDFPHVIGITTDKEYRHVADNHAFSLRFDRVDIGNTTETENLEILAETVLKSPQKPLVEPAAFQALLKASPSGEPQPTASIKLLKKCIQATEKTQLSKTQKDIIALTSQISSLHFQAAATRSLERSKDDITGLETRLCTLKDQALKEEAEAQKLQKAKLLLDEVTRLGYQTALDQNVTHFMLLKECLAPFLWGHIRQLAGTLKVNAIVDAALVQRCAAQQTPEKSVNNRASALDPYV